jgi:Domain of unknown function (DUF5916)
MSAKAQRRLPWTLVATLICVPGVGAQSAASTQSLQVGKLPADLRVDGRLDEPAWQQAPAIDGLTTFEPQEGGTPTGRTTVRVLADKKTIVIGVRCEDPSADDIVSYSVARDASLDSEDHIKIALGTFLDGRTGYVFSVNPRGARRDAVVANRGEGSDAKWDGIWEAKTRRDAKGWTAEIRIPVYSLSFKRGLTSWHFNVERKIQRLLERSRWAGARRDYRITQTSRAGRLVGLPAFSLGAGLSIKPSGVGSLGSAGPGLGSGLDGDASLDVNFRPTSDLTAALTFRTDFAETEVDTRRTNLTRFPLFFPEKRTFFVEGSDAFDFGLGLGRAIVPFHSRRIGLVRGEEVPILVGGKVTGRIGGTSIGALTVRTDMETGVAPASTMGVVRVRQDVLAESSVGVIGTRGDPLDRPGSWTAGADFTYQTSEMFGDRNFLVGAWGLAMDRDDIAGSSRSSWGTKIDYPNDLWDTVFEYRRVGKDFDPSLGFVQRTGIKRYRFGTDFAPRPDLAWLRQTRYEFQAIYITDLSDHWESYRVFFTPVNWDLESGDSFEVYASSMGERFGKSFEIADGINIPAGEYEWTRYGASFDTAAKRELSGEIGYAYGPFYSGHLATVELDATWNPTPLLEIGVNGEHNMGRLPQGKFTEDVYGLVLGFNFSPDLTLRSFVQYDTESDSLGTNTRVRWTITPLSEMFFVINYNARKPPGRDLRTQSYETILKLQYEFRF